MKRLSFLFAALAVAMLFTMNAQAQYYAYPAQRGSEISDALRLASTPDAISARAAGMGNAFIGVADDYSAIYFNPAGLGQLRRPEFTLGLANFNGSTDATFLGATDSYDNSSTHLNLVGLALPFPVSRGSLVLALGYNRLVNFSNGRAFSGYNSGSSIQTSLYDVDANYDLAWQLGLEDTTQLIPIENNVRQDADILESGSLDQWSFAGSMEVAPNLMVGLTLNILSGSYSWDREWKETDERNIHQGLIAGIEKDRTDFQSLRVSEKVDQDLTGYNIKVGGLYNLNDMARFGFTIQTPSVITVAEDFNRSGRSDFADDTRIVTEPTALNEYEVQTPWVFGFGASYSPVEFVTVSGDVELTDYSTLSFETTPATAFESGIEDFNREIKRTFRSTNNFRVGAEFTVPKTGLQVRGGFGYRFTPYQELKDQSDYNVQTISGGLGYTFEEAVTIYATYMLSSYKIFHYNYKDPFIATPGTNDGSVRTDEEVKLTNLMFGFAYRF